MILISGATGRIGGAAAATLANAGTPFRAFVRDTNKFSLGTHDGVDVAKGSFEDADSLRAALKGVTSALLVTGNGEKQLDLEKAFADTAASSGVRHIVKISSMEAGPDTTAAFPKLHYDSENHVKSLDLDWTMVRPNFFMQNLLLFAAGIKNAGVIALPFGDAKVSMLDASDVGAFCATLLQQDGHAGKTYDVTGEGLMDFNEIAACISDGIDKEVRYIDQDPAEFKAFLGQFVTNEWHLNGVCGLFAEIANGSLEKSTTAMSDLLGRAPTSLRQFVSRYQAAFTD